jgi:hypothetical protein
VKIEGEDISLSASNLMRFMGFVCNVLRLGTKRIEKLFRDEMELAHVQHRGTVFGQIAMTNEAASERVSFDAEAFQKEETVSGFLAETVFAVASEAYDPAHRGDLARRLDAGLGAKPGVSCAVSAGGAEQR